MTTAEKIFAALASGPGPRSLGGYKAVDTNVETSDGFVVLAIDESGLRHLLVPVPSHADGRADLGAAVTIRTRSLTDRGRTRRFVDVACTEPRLFDLFDRIATEMLAEVAANPDQDKRRVCQHVVDRWRQLLRRSSEVLGREQLAGLAGELWWLLRIARRAPERALEVWTGPEGLPHDITGIGLSIEIKTMTGTGDSVEIHGINQLEPPRDSDLILAIVHLGPPQDSTSISVPSLIDDLDDAGVEMLSLLEKLSKVGYSEADRESYEEYKWGLVEESLYEVGAEFPRLTPRTTDFGTFVGPVRYQIILDRCGPRSQMNPDDLVERIVVSR